MAWSSHLLKLLFVSVLWPQPSYIHPDEFFQSTEIVAGDIFNITHLRTWEFQDTTAPIRDIMLPYLLYAPGYCILNTALHYFPELSSYISESYAVLVIPRLIVAFVGLINYRLVRQLCSSFYVDSSTAAWYWLTSYVVWSFLTHTFSNTIETALFSSTFLLLLNLEECHKKIYSWRISCTKNQATKLADSQKSFGPFKLYSFLLGVVLCLGVFNRPTFVVFAVVPLLWWLDQLVVRGLWKRHELASVFLTLCGIVLTAVAMSVGNSLYYNPKFFHLLCDVYLAAFQKDMGIIIQSAASLVSALIIPPWNFIQFNLSLTNLAEHGLHPWYFHLCVNLPMILGPLYFVICFDLLKMMRNWRRTELGDVLYTMVMIPPILLSFFPHQEARFLLPVLPVAVVCAAKNSLSGWRTMRVVTILFNVAAFIVFGLLHQGGVTPAMSEMHNLVKASSISPASHGERFNVIAYSSYMLPRHLLFHKLDSKVEVYIDDLVLGQNRPSTLRLKLQDVKAECEKAAKSCWYFVLAAGPAVEDLQSIPGLSLKEKTSYCPHVSAERLPADIKLSDLQTLNGWRQLLRQLCLKLISVTF